MILKFAMSGFSHEGIAHSESHAEHTTGDDVAWVPLVLAFAAFLDSVGYLGVRAKVEKALESV